jgi:PAS domain S-box-containing protein
MEEGDARRADALLLRSVLETTNQGVWLLDADDRTTFVNARMADMLGCDVRQAIGRSPLDFMDAEWGPVFAAHVEQCRAGQARHIEVRFTRRDGTSMWAFVDASPVIDDEGQVAGALAMVTDVTARIEADQARQRLEDQLRQAQKMEAIGRLAGGVAHDFNNVLSVILSYAELSLGDLKPSDPIRDNLEEIHKAAKRAAGLTRQLLMFGRQQVLEPRVLDLNDVLADVDKMLRRVLGADIDLVCVPATGLGYVRADVGSLEQVLMNLVVNARDAMPTGGKLTLETANVTLDEDDARAHPGATPGPHVMLAVTDTGIGMDRATLARVFEPFFTTKPKGKGTGLGLSTVFGIVQQSEGTVWVYSERGKGTTFKVYLPRVDGEVEPRRPAVPPATIRGAETVLLVDDDDDVRVAARSILQRNGYRVIDVRNAGEALLVAERHPQPIHLLLTDVVMPQMSGPQLALRLASSRPEMKVLCMSGYTDDSIVRHGVLAGEIAFLQKPVTPATLGRRVREVLDGALGPSQAADATRTG